MKRFWPNLLGFYLIYIPAIRITRIGFLTVNHDGGSKVDRVRIRELNKLDLSDRLQELVERLKRENDNRPAFLDEISSFRVL
jgi:hypothetical protein